MSVKMLKSPDPSSRKRDIASAAILAVDAAFDQSLLVHLFHQTCDCRCIDPELTGDSHGSNAARRGVGKFTHERKPRSRDTHCPAESIDEHLIGPQNLPQEMLLFTAAVETSNKRIL